VGIWSNPLRRGDEAEAVAAIREIEALGYGAAWLPGGEEGLGERLSAVLGATRQLPVATGIVNIWTHPAARTAAMFSEVDAAHPGRLVLGVGVGHAPLVDAGHPGRYREPLASTARYLEELDSATPQVPRSRRVLAAFGPKMLELAGREAVGAHPYLTAPSHTAWARSILGPDALLACEQHAVLEPDPVVARAIARSYMTTYWSLPNYLNNFRRMGFADADFEDGGSDRLIDGLVAWGDEDAVLARAQEHFDAGADHVCIQVLTPGRIGFPLAEWRRLAVAFGLPTRGS
jgi:probable F420-dependent oxidoreductase